MIEITEVRVKLMEADPDGHDRLLAFCSVVLGDAFVVRDLKIIGGAKGAFVAMPSRKLADRCRECGTKNHLQARFCNKCGRRLEEDRARRDADGRSKLHADVAHPITVGFRDAIEDAVMEAYHDELESSRLPGYMPSYLDFDADRDSGDGGAFEVRKAV